MLAISHFTGHAVYLGLDSANNLLLMLTLGGQRRDLRQRPHQHSAGRGARVLFAAFVMLIFQA